MTDIPDELLKLERSTEEERARLAGLTGDEYEEQQRRWCAVAEALHAAITAHAEATGADPHELEGAVRLAVRQGQEDPAVE
ncbi:hypothetical protein [Streptomyces naphthomycinicus]|uniref:hypothetical protein n=1 Tax=Streptomyces naphthomycinicus TaxID=2872625 RepID=UPI001CEC3FD1|nr:hypothetical protein [Streptomyces sp. TML10]